MVMLRCAAGARILPGAELVGSWLDLDRRMAECDMVVTGEGQCPNGIVLSPNAVREFLQTTFLR